MPLKTMLAGTITDEDLTEDLFKYGPLIAMPKFDGIRVQVERSIAYSGREGKLLPNEYVQSFVQMQLSNMHLDGEMLALDRQSGDVLPFADIILTDGSRIAGIESELMSRGGAPRFRYMVFDDLTHPSNPYCNRLQLVKSQVEFLRSIGMGPYIQIAPSVVIHSRCEFREVEQTYLDQGYEGMITRWQNGPYKQGRSTLREGYLLKRKPYVDCEAYIVGMEPLYSEVNQKLMNTMGCLVCASSGFELGFNLGTGFTPALRQWFWDNREDLISNHQMITFKYQKHGTQLRPRSPVFLNLRNFK